MLKQAEVQTEGVLNLIAQAQRFALTKNCPTYLKTAVSGARVAESTKTSQAVK